MRILMGLDATFPPDVRVEREAEALTAAGHEVHLLCYRHDRAEAPEEVWGGLTIHRPYVPRQAAKKMLGLIFHVPLYTYLWRRLIGRAVARLRPDAVHVHDLPLGLPASQVLQGRAERPAFILDLHENYPDLLRNSPVAGSFPQRLFFDFERWVQLEGRLVGRADHVIVVSEENGQRLRQEHGCTRPIWVVPNVVSLEGFEAALPSPRTRSFFEADKLNLLYVGGLDPTRGLETVLEGLSRANASGERLNLVIVGAGSARGVLEGLAERLGLREAVRFAGHVPQQEVGAFCRSADLCLLPLKPSRHTDLTDPNKLYQYAYFAKPVLAAGTTFLERRVREMGCGRTYRPGDPDSFAAVLQEMAADRAVLAAYGERGRRSVEETFNWEAKRQVLLDLYEAVGHGPTRGLKEGFR